MKNAYFYVLAMIFAAFTGFSQCLPKGEYIAQPTGDDGRSVFVYWLNSDGNDITSHRLEADFDESGQVTKLSYSGGSWDFGTRFEFKFPSEENSNIAFKDLSDWKQFASKVQNSFAIINDRTYVDKRSWTVSSWSMALDNLEFPRDLQAMILKRGQRTLSISLDKWCGPLPKKGESVIIGQTKRGEYFFQAKMVSREWQVPKELTERLEQDQKEVELAAKAYEAEQAARQKK